MGERSGLSPTPHMDTATDEGLLAASAAGDQFAFGLLVGRHRSYLLTVADSILHNLTDAEDLVQDVLAEVWRKLDRYEPGRSSVKTWLVTITRNRALDRLDSMARYSRRVENSAIGKPKTTNRRIGEVSDLVSVIEQMAGFTKVQREAWECTFISGMTKAEAAKHLGISKGTYGTRLDFCKREIARVLSDIEREGSQVGVPLTPKKRTGPKTVSYTHLTLPTN